MLTPPQAARGGEWGCKIGVHIPKAQRLKRTWNDRQTDRRTNRQTFRYYNKRSSRKRFFRFFWKFKKTLLFTLF